MSNKDKITKVKSGDEVKRNENNWIWGDQDGNGKGTVISHDKNSNFPIIVQWNKNQIKNSYRYVDLKMADHSNSDDLLDMLEELEEKFKNN